MSFKSVCVFSRNFFFVVQFALSKLAHFGCLSSFALNCMAIVSYIGVVVVVVGVAGIVVQLLCTSLVLLVVGNGLFVDLLVLSTRGVVQPSKLGVELVSSKRPLELELQLELVLVRRLRRIVADRRNGSKVARMHAIQRLRAPRLLFLVRLFLLLHGNHFRRQHSQLGGKFHKRQCNRTSQFAFRIRRRFLCGIGRLRNRR